MRTAPLLLLLACSPSSQVSPPEQQTTCDPSEEVTVFPDLDGDGYGADAGAYSACSPSASGASEVGGDCDDSDPLMTPADQDQDGWSSCDGDCDDTDASLLPTDDDGDGWTLCDGDCDDADPTLNLDDVDADTWTSCDGDCNDNNAGRNLDDADGDSFSTCDDDCDDTDPELTPTDLDGDGVSTCDGDCDDADPVRFAGAIDTCLDGIDQDCDGADDPCSAVFGMGSDVDVNETRTDYFRGHVFLATAAVNLVDFGWYLDLSSACDIDYYVHEGPSMNGPWNTIFLQTVNHGPANDFHWSPNIDIPLTIGQYYGIGMGWNCSATYYIDYSGWGGAYPLGEYVQNYSDNSYPGFNQNYAPPNASGSPTAAHYSEFAYH